MLKYIVKNKYNFYFYYFTSFQKHQKRRETGCNLDTQKKRRETGCNLDTQIHQTYGKYVTLSINSAT